jgi:hypothetical protein
MPERRHVSAAAKIDICSQRSKLNHYSLSECKSVHQFILHVAPRPILSLERQSHGCAILLLLLFRFVTAFSAAALP